VDRREFHQTALAGLLAAAVPTADPASTPAAIPPLPHAPDAVPPEAVRRLGTTRFWHLPEAGNDGLNALAFAPDGRQLAALGYQDGQISLWEVPSGRLIRRWQGDDADRCGELAWSPDGRLLASACNDGLSLFDPTAGRRVRRLADDCYHGVAFSPDGRLLAGPR
jgi:WD40 repeat protein